MAQLLMTGAPMIDVALQLLMDSLFSDNNTTDKVDPRNNFTAIPGSSSSVPLAASMKAQFCSQDFGSRSPKPFSSMFGNDLFGAGEKTSYPSSDSNANSVSLSGLGLILVTSILQWVSSRWGYLSKLVRQQCSTRITGDTEVYTYVSEYLADHSDRLFVKHSTFDFTLSFIGRIPYYLSGWFLFADGSMKVDAVKSTVCTVVRNPEDKGAFAGTFQKRPELVFVPDNGTYTFAFKRSTLEIRVSEEAAAAVPSPQPQNNGSPMGHIYGNNNNQKQNQQETQPRKTVSIYNTGHNADIIREFIKEAMDYHFKKHCDKVGIFTPVDMWNGIWKKSTMRTPRSLESITLKDGMMDELVDDLKSFMGAQEWYTSHGIPYRRGYILYGPPGTGKTSTIVALASKFDMNVCLVSINVNDVSLLRCMSGLPPRSLLIFEDIDQALESADDPLIRTRKVTVSGLLNALDGISTPEGKIVFLTTNSIESLPAALLRPGRCDRRFLFGYSDHAMITHLFARFFEMDMDREEAHAFAKEIADQVPKDVNLTSAQLQGLFVQNRLNPKAIPGKIGEFLKEVEEQKIEAEKEQERKIAARKARMEKGLPLH
ncbi:hypothetical protein HDU97_004255 [Phlyctochytrium planicorne]|nr:hypothetical protein HDU97_004255 [Phlyctochytrium planicorne]